MRETGRMGFTTRLIKELEHRFPGCVIFHQDPNHTHQGIPDLLILWRDRWAMLESKGAIDKPKRPNQEFYVNFYNELSFASFIYPENEEEVLDGLQRSFTSRRRPRISQR